MATEKKDDKKFSNGKDQGAGKGRNPGKGKKYYRKPKPGSKEKDNFQDKFSDKEYDKGFKAAESLATSTGAKNNNPEWYIPNEQIAKDVASISFDAAIGRPIIGEWNYDAAGSVTPYHAPITDVPGILAMGYVPSVGAAQSELDGVNVGSEALYTYIRAQINKSNTVYEKSDLIKYIVALDGPYALRSWMIRLYGAMNWITVFNRYTPQALVESMGVNYDDLSSNLAEFRAFVNQYTLKISQFPIPKDISYVVRHIWLNENIFKDSDTEKAQYYLFIPSSLYVYEEGTEATVNGSQLNLVPFTVGHTTGNGLTFADIKAYANSLLQPILKSEDFQFISGDILKAFGSDAMVNMNMIAENFAITPVFSEEVLSQIENTEIQPDYMFGQIIEQTGINQGYIIENIGIQTTNFPYPPLRSEHVINFHHMNPTPQDVFVATRLMAGRYNPTATKTLTSSYGTTEICPLYNIGSEVIDSAMMYYYNANNNLVRFHINQVIPMTTEVVDRPNFDGWKLVLADLYSTLGHLAVYASFDWAPKVSIYGEFYGTRNNISDNISSFETQSFTDYDVVTQISDNVLDNINRASLLKQFNVPNMTGLTFR